MFRSANFTTVLIYIIYSISIYININETAIYISFSLRFISRQRLQENLYYKKNYITKFYNLYFFFTIGPKSTHAVACVVSEIFWFTQPSVRSMESVASLGTCYFIHTTGLPKKICSFFL